MIIVKFKGGLGNQMFQYAFGKKLSIDRNTNLKFDKTFLDNKIWQKITGVTVRSYELGEFNVKVKFTSFWDKIFPVLNGYWQNEKHFKDIRNILIEDFDLKYKSKNFLKISKIVSRPNSVGIHFRRGDYAERAKTNKYHGLVSLGYYKKAICLIGRKIKNPHFYIFSDDVDWVKKNFQSGKSTTYISGSCKLKNAEELALMCKCKHNIIANSSFSWWGAWLNNNPKKIVIAPKKWFGVGVESRGIVPKNWIRI
jgi:hypothetical protein